MVGDNYLGSDALSPEQAEEYDKHYEIVLIKLEKAAQESQAAREFLQGTLGQAIRNTLYHSKIHAMKELADNAMAEDFMRYKHHYDVICGVESVFGQIIAEGEQALEQLKHMVTNDE